MTPIDKLKLSEFKLRKIEDNNISLDSLRSLMGHHDITTTDRYATIDRLSLVRFLNVIPKIETKEKFPNRQMSKVKKGIK